tara:strand:+ start:1101 stop:1643 length:543 start_codon:yes stop_codon:yes gene_type:complete
MSLEKIKKTILDEANNKSNEIKSEYKTKANAVLEENKKEVEHITTKKEDEIINEVALFQKNSIAKEKLALKSKYLERREEIFNSLLDDALKNLTQNEIETYMKKVLDENKDLFTGKVNITCEKKFTKFVEDNAKFKNFKVSESEKFILESEGTKVNASLNNLIERKKSLLRQGALRVLGV